ncbi:discoidin domain-containing protein [Clostridium septicum]|uniref:Beta-N-acetylhexosaminidase n=2 Tax=Clostridium septicum TaxID=1504 RepID=A0A9N7JM84_CLOSE|nr:discoidin domain-containing protein [Clostridium septicum]AYE35153.1 cell wall anchor protein [Clostridium septicum]QAS60556.1 cell wall anchor protein [Clostridium septicum]UEC20195.1 discoidin domain-containing protein [Clostridium septicum]USS01750.1 discoidin domain-containing protein [Clostridium septicum]
MIRRNKKLWVMFLSAMVITNSFTFVKAETNLVKKNIALEPGVIATSSDNETSDLSAGKAIDGVVDYQKATGQSRWASNTTSPTEENKKWLKIDLGEVKNFNEIVIDWERKNATNYIIEVSNDDTNWRAIKEFTNSPTEYRQVIPLDNSENARYIRLSISGYSQTATKRDTNGNDADVTWNTVSVFELEVYSGELVEPSYTIDEVINSISAPVINKGDKKMPMPEVPEGFEIEFVGADYEQIIGADGTIYEPLVNTNVEVNFRVKKGEEERTTSPLNIVVPGKYESNTGNEKPKVIPELAEWHGTEGNFEVSNNTKIIIDSAYSNELMKTANKFASDYKNILNKEITVEEGTEAVANSFFLTLDTADDGLCSEGNLITIDDSVKIEGKSAQGIFYATRSILQILKQNQTTLPQGVVRDYPKYKVRGFMLDVARKSYELSSLKELAENMAWYKLNDLQVHLNDNYIFLEDYINSDKSNIEDAYDAYSAFRLESSLRNERGEGITSTDLFYTKDEFREFIKESRELGINIVPEIDTPAHALAFTKVFKNLALEGWNPRITNRPVLDHLDLGNPQSLEFVKTLFNEYMEGENPVFDGKTTVHVGTDEYEANAEQYRAFTDSMLGHIQDTGRTVRMWGGLSWLRGETPVRSEGVQINLWSRDWANPAEMFEAGYDLINTLDSDLYIVPAAGYYANYLNAQHLYNNWEPNTIGGKYIPAGDDQMLGAAYAIWNDSIDKRSQKISEYDVFDRFYKPLPALAEKMWGDGEDKTFAQLNELSSITGTAPNTNPYYTVESATPSYVEYDFEEKEILDKSGNNHNSISKNNVSFEAGKKGKALKLNGGESYVETPIKRVGLPNSISFWVKKDGNAPEGEQILFESPSKFDNYAIKAVNSNGKVGFTRERDNFSFNYTLPNDEWVHLTIASQNERTMLYVNNELVDTLGNRPVATLLIPFERIGSTTNSFKGLIDGIVLGSQLPQDETIVDSSNFTVTSDNENALVGEVEGPAYLAFDNNLETRWHTNYSPVQPLPATIEVDMKEVQTIDKITYIPRQDGNENGRVTNCEIFVKANAEDDYTKVNTSTWENNMSNKYAKFDEVEARYVKIVVNEGAANFGSAAEFTIHKVATLEKPEVPEQEQTGINMVVPEEITVGNDFDLNVNLSDIKENMYAMEFEVDYDETKVDFKKATSIDPAKYLVSAKAKDGKVRVIVAGLGVQLENSKDIAKLTFTANSSGENVAFELINGKVANGEGVEESTKNSTATINIKEGVNKGDLLTAIENAKNIIENEKDKYTEASINNLKEAVDLAEKVMANESATQEQVNIAKEAIETEIGNLEEKGQEPEVTVDKAQLQGLVDKVKDIDSSKYIPSTWKGFEEKLEAAKTILVNENVNQEDVDRAYNELLKAYLDLRLIPDKSLLEELVKEVESIDLSKYTVNSANKVRKALEKAKKVLANKEATQEEVDSALEELRISKNSLVANAGSNSSNNNSGSSNNGNIDGGKLPQAGSPIVGGTLLSGLIALLGGVALNKKRNRK